jgi:tetratricopeptide (TPR) repeat protein
MSSPPLAPFSLLGVTLAFFEEFISTHGGRSAFLGKTTTDVNTTFLVPATSATKISMCDQLISIGRTDVVGKATWFVSHAWKFLFLDVFDSLVTYFCPNDGDDVSSCHEIVWFDMFSNSQHDTGSKPFEWWTGTFTNAIRDLNNVLMIMIPWDAPIPLTRTWCIFEIYACQLTNSRFEITTTPAERSRFMHMIRDDIGQFLNMLSRVSSRSSECFIPDDRLKIFAAIEQSVGFTQLDSTVFRVFENWMSQQLARQSMLSADATESASWLRSLSELYLQQGKYSSAEDAVSACLRKRQEAVGTTHESALSALSTLARVHMFQTQYARAECELRSCLEGQEALFGAEHIQTIFTRMNMGILYHKMQFHDRAEPVLVSCLVSLEHSPEFSKRYVQLAIANICSCLGKVLKCTDRYADAGAMFDRCHDIRVNLLGPTHTETCKAVMDKADLAYCTAAYDHSFSLYESCLPSLSRQLGPNHMDTQAIMCSMANIWRLRGNFDEAEALYQESLAARIASLGISHEETLKTMFDLGVLKICQGQHEAAASHLKLCQAQSTASFGPSHHLALCSASHIRCIDMILSSVRDIKNAYFPTCTDMELICRDFQLEVFDKLPSSVSLQQHEHALVKV